MCPHDVTLKLDQQNKKCGHPSKLQYGSLKNKLFRARRERRRLKAIIRRREAHIERLERKVARLAGDRAANQGARPPRSRPNDRPGRLYRHPGQWFAALCGQKMMGWQATTLIGDFVGFIDESIQIGGEKLLLFLAVRIDVLSSLYRPLTMEDVVVLGAEVRSSWKAAQVAGFIKDRLAHHGELSLRYMVSDQGTNLLGATEILGIDAVNDCSHVLMNALKKELADDESLQEVTKFMGEYRRKNMLSERTHLCPPTLRDKDRFLKIFVILDWVERINSYQGLCAAYRATLALMYEPKVLLMLANLAQVRRIISISTRILKTSGINQQSRESWCRHLAAYRRKNKLCPLAEKLVSTVNNYFDRHEYLLEKHGRLICCSDIIESVFGRYKNKGGMKVISADVLHIPLYTRTIDDDFIVQGPGQVNQPMVREWHNECSCDNRFSILYRLRKEAETVTAAA